MRMSERKDKVHAPGCLHREPGVTICTCSPESPPSASLPASDGRDGAMVPRLDLGGSGPCLECDSPHLFGERCAPELSSTTRTSPSEHLGACGHELDPWESHLEHAPDCRREICIDDSHCTCPEVCPDCCRSCGYDLAERMGS